MTVDHTNTEAIEHVAGLAPLQRAGEPEEIADLAVFLLGNASSFITGSTHLIDGGMLASLS
jgi:NAD(P)-dependent dehydrogenase (short-subunit alcohol dehydrogenase family)